MTAVFFVACQSKSGPRVIFTDASGRELTAQSLEGSTGKVKWEIVGALQVSAKARELHEQGRGFASSGDNEQALARFREASRLAPSWPYPIYDAAYLLMLAGENKQAEEFYSRVERLSPRGFFTAKTELDCLQRERAGEVPADFCKQFAMLEWENDKNKQRDAYRKIVQRHPTYAPAWKAVALASESDEDKATAIERGLAANPDPETKGILLVNKALLLQRQGQRAKAVEMLGALALDPQSTLAAEALAKATLQALVP